MASTGSNPRSASAHRFPTPPLESSGAQTLGTVPRAAETAPAYGEENVETRDTVHAVVTESEGWYVAECLELAVVTQARSFDDLLVNLREALALHIEGEDAAWLGLSSGPRLLVSYEAAPLGT